MSLLALLAARAAEITPEPAPEPDPTEYRSVYLIPHQDDETLTCGAAILSEVQAGREVICMLATRGEKANNNMSSLLGRPVTADEVQAARDKEFTEACRRLGATPILPADRMPDSGSTVAGIVALAKANIPQDKPILLRATSQHDYHGDHRNCGRAMAQLAAEGFGTDPRHMVAAQNVQLVTNARPSEPIMQMGEHGDVTTWHQWPYLNVDPGNGWFGIGSYSAGPWFDKQINIDGRTHWHRLT